MPAFFDDPFTEASDTTLASHVPATGTGWSLLWRDGALPSFTVIGASDTCKATGANDSGVIYTANATYPSADYEVQWTHVTSAAFATRPYYVFVRLADQENMYAVRMSNVAGGCRLYKKVAGLWAALGTAVTVAAGSVCKLQIIGTSLKLFDDGAEVASATVSDLSATGKAGIGSGGGAELVANTDDSNSLTEIDNFSVTDLGAAPTGQLTMARWRGIPGMRLGSRVGGW